MITDSTGVVKGTQDHLPFGEEGGTTGTSEKHRFTSYERDSESGTDYAVNRQYHSASGKFMRPDPVGGSMGDPQSANRYSYALNDPVNLADPPGLDPFDWMTDASKHGPGVYLDGMEVMPEMWGMVFNLWAIGAADIDFPGRALFNSAPDWYKKEYGLQNPNDLFRDLPLSLRDAIHLARDYLLNESCRGLFTIDPVNLLNDLARGNAGIGSFRYANLGGRAGGTATAAETKGILGSRTVTGSQGQLIRQSVFTGATITINSNSAAPFQSGYGGRFGVSDAMNRAITVIQMILCSSRRAD